MSDKLPKKTGRGSNLRNGPGKGRPKGAENKTTRILKEAILEAAHKAGGTGGMTAFLLKQAKKRNNAPFMAILGRVLPMQVTGEDGGPVKVQNLSDAELLAIIEKAKHG